MNGRLLLLCVATLALAGCNPLDLLFPKDERLGEEAENICIGRVRATLTYEAYQELENAPGRFVPSYIYDITRLDLEAVQALVASGADETAGTRLVQQTANTSAAVERFKQTAVDEKGALFLGQDPALYKLRGKAQPASTILASGCARQQPDMRLIEVTWSRVGGAGSAAAGEQAEPAANEPAEMINLESVSNRGGVR
jgi:hypothetical protein